MTKQVLDTSSVLGCQELLDSIKVTDDGIDASSTLLKVFSEELPSALAVLIKNEGGHGKKQVHRLVHDFCEKCEKLLEDYSRFPNDNLVALLGGVAQYPSIFSEFPILRKTLLKLLISIWSSSPSEDTRVAAFLTIHSFCKKYSKLQEICLKSMYQHYYNACRSLSSHNLAQASLMLNGLVEIFTLSPAKGSEYAAKYIRRMGELVQAATKQPKKELLNSVICWQFVSATRLWTQLLIRTLDPSKKSAKTSPYQKLLSPVCSLLNILLAFQTSPRHYGFHFHCIAAAIDLSAHLGVVIPIAAPLLKITGYLAKQPLYKLETKKAAYDLVATIKVPKSEVSTKGYLECVFDETAFYLMLWASKSVDATFPEKVAPIVAVLNDMTDRVSQIDRNLKKQIEGHVSKLVQQKKEIEAWRIVEGLTPLRLKESPCAVPKDRLILSDYISSMEKVRLMRRKILADRQAEEASDHDGEDDESECRSSSKGEKPGKSKVKGEVASSERPSKKRKASNSDVPSDRTPSKKSKEPKESKKTSRSAKHADDEEDIVEDFVLD